MRNKIATAIRMKKMAMGGAAESSNDGDTLGSIIGYPGSPKPKGMAYGGLSDSHKISTAIRAAKMAAGGEVLKDSDDFLSADMSDEANESANDELETEQYPDDDDVENPQKKRIAGIFSRMK